MLLVSIRLLLHCVTQQTNSAGRCSLRLARADSYCRRLSLSIPHTGCRRDCSQLSGYMDTAARPVRAQLSGVVLLQVPVRGSYRSTMVQGSEPCSCSLPALPPITYSLPPTQATLQLERACCGDGR